MFQPRSPARERGFTLIELIIVVAVIAVLATIAVPNLLSARNNAAEPAVLGALRAITTAQSQAMAHGLVDTDGDGVGEAMSLAEMAGTLAPRGSSIPLSPALLSPSLGQVDANGRVQSHGYHFALFFADAAGLGVDTANGSLAKADANMSENFWSCVAWPVRSSGSSDAAWFVNHTGQILMCKPSPYIGPSQAPPAGAGLLGVASGCIHSNQCANGVQAADGNVWIVVR